jgi:uncharacterized protein YigA (DUF484 family)
MELRSDAPLPKRDEAKLAPEAGPTGAEVLAYLRRHPEFLSRHPEVLGAQKEGDAVVDLRQFLVRKLQDEVRSAQTDYSELVATSRANHSAQARVHTAVLAIISARSFEHLMEVMTSDLAIHLDADVVSLCIENQTGGTVKAPMRGIRILEPGAVETLMGKKREVVLRPYVAGDPLLFGPGAGIVRSDALLRLDLGHGTPDGVLALGSRTEGQFLPAQGTELLTFLAQAIAVSIRSWLDLPEP